MAMAQALLRPNVQFADDRAPTRAALKHLHYTAHQADLMLRATVDIEISLQRWVGRWKVGQHRPMEDRLVGG